PARDEGDEAMSRSIRSKPRRRRQAPNRVDFRVDPELKARLKALQDALTGEQRRKLSLSEVVRRLIDLGLPLEDQRLAAKLGGVAAPAVPPPSPGGGGPARRGARVRRGKRGA